MRRPGRRWARQGFPPTSPALSARRRGSGPPPPPPPLGLGAFPRPAAGVGASARAALGRFVRWAGAGGRPGRSLRGGRAGLWGGGCRCPAGGYGGLGGGGPRGEGPAPGTGGGVEEASRSGERRGVAPPRLAWSGAGGRGPPRGGSEFGGPAGLQGTSAARCGTPSYQNTGATSPSDKEMTCTADSDNGCLSRLA